MKIDKITAEKIKSVANIVEVVSDYVDLRKSGTEWEGLCPFHEDRHLGSFKVSPKKNICSCFSCGAFYDPVGFIMAIEHIEYPDALMKLAKKFGVFVEGNTSEWKPTRMPRLEPPELPLMTIPKQVVKITMDARENTNFVQWLRSLNWSDIERQRIDKVLWQYCVGGWTDGRTVFWQVDEHGGVRSGKLMKYKPDGHRDKTCNPGWVHNQSGVREYLDLEHTSFRRTLFGMHLMHKYADAVINIVESEKTALICAIAYGNTEKNLWVASGGLEALNKTVLEPLLNSKREIYLWPDRDGVQKWREKVRNIGNSRVTLFNQYLREWQPEDYPKADIADMIVRMLKQRM